MPQSFQCALHASSAIILALSAHAAQACQSINIETTSVSAPPSMVPTPQGSSSINSTNLPTELVKPQGIKADPAEQEDKNGVPVLATEPSATASRPNEAATSSIPTNKPSSGVIRGEPQSDIVVTADQHLSKIDPLKTVNVKSFEAAQAADAAVLRPIAMAYQHVLPEPIRDGLHNFLGNIHEPVVALNYLFQLKPVRVVKTAVRFAINSTIGVAGLFDFAQRRPFKLRYHPNGFADTLGFYGVKPGPFLYLPLIGPTTPRDLLGDVIDRSVIPLTLGKLPFAELFGRAPYGTSSTIIRVLDRRVRFDETLRTLKEENTSLYVARRRLYFRERQTEIDNLHHPAKED